MMLPTLEQTAALWIMRTWNQEYCYVQDVFSADTPIDRTHRDNCWLLIKKHFLMPEVDDGLKPYLRIWDIAMRYHLTPASIHSPIQNQVHDRTPDPSNVYHALQVGI